MKRDRLHHDADEIHNPKDLIDARTRGGSHFAQDLDAFEEDLGFLEEIDVDHALTFPHPKHRHGRDRGNVELMSTPNELDMDEDWDAQDVQPTDYQHDYNEGTTTYPTDDPDVIAEEQVHEMGHVVLDDVSAELEIEVLPGKLEGHEET